MEIAQQLYLQCSYAVFRDAEEAAADYEKNLIALKSAHEMFLQSVRHIQDLAERLENIDADLEEIRYDLSGAQRQLAKVTQEHTSVVEQLKLTDYEQIRERLDACVAWLSDYPEELNQCAQKRAKSRGTSGYLCVNRKKPEKFTGDIGKVYLEKEMLRGRAGIAYVPFPEDMQMDIANICNI